MMSKRSFSALIALTALMLLLSLVGCRPSTPTPAAGETPAPPKENVAVYAHPTSFPDIDPSISYSNDSAVVSNLYETLVWYNPPMQPQLLRPGLAERWESNADATEWTFYLRKGVKFHDGTDLNAQAVKYSIERTINMGMGASYIWDPVEEITVVDDSTVRFKLKYPAPPGPHRGLRLRLLDFQPRLRGGSGRESQRVVQRGPRLRERPVYH